MSGPREEPCPFCDGEPMSPDCGVCGGAGTLPVMDPSILHAARVRDHWREQAVRAMAQDTVDLHADILDAVGDE